MNKPKVVVLTRGEIAALASIADSALKEKDRNKLFPDNPDFLRDLESALGKLDKKLEEE